MTRININATIVSDTHGAHHITSATHTKPIKYICLTIYKGTEYEKPPRDVRVYTFHRACQLRDHESSSRIALLALSRLALICLLIKTHRCDGMQGARCDLIERYRMCPPASDIISSNHIYMLAWCAECVRDV